MSRSGGGSFVLLAQLFSYTPLSGKRKEWEATPALKLHSPKYHAGLLPRRDLESYYNALRHNRRRYKMLNPDVPPDEWPDIIRYAEKSQTFVPTTDTRIDLGPSNRRGTEWRATERLKELWQRQQSGEITPQELHRLQVSQTASRRLFTRLHPGRPLPPILYKVPDREEGEASSSSVAHKRPTSSYTPLPKAVDKAGNWIGTPRLRELFERYKSGELPPKDRARLRRAQCCQRLLHAKLHPGRELPEILRSVQDEAKGTSGTLQSQGKGLTSL